MLILNADGAKENFQNNFGTHGQISQMLHYACFSSFRTTNSVIFEQSYLGAVW